MGKWDHLTREELEHKLESFIKSNKLKQDLLAEAEILIEDLKAQLDDCDKPDGKPTALLGWACAAVLFIMLLLLMVFGCASANADLPRSPTSTASAGSGLKQKPYPITEDTGRFDRVLIRDAFLRTAAYYQANYPIPQNLMFGHWDEQDGTLSTQVAQEEWCWPVQFDIFEYSCPNGYTIDFAGPYGASPCEDDGSICGGYYKQGRCTPRTKCLEFDGDGECVNWADNQMMLVCPMAPIYNGDNSP